MYLRSLELQGFKSFPDKYKLEFDKGLTAVVGPNGSGKSNIGDAMRWVLGEQSSKSLRGGKMEDVIFSGTEKRKAVGFAQATLNIDNCDRTLDVDSDTVSVSRKLYRNGDSEYMINGAGVRLKDVLELFMDTGLGRDGYSIIGQGKIADIVSNKSADRREIFEEAAGISKFRYKKEEAERKLAAADDNILRLGDIIGELSSRIGPLKAQSEKAKKFIELDEEKRRLEISVWVKQLDSLTESITSAEDRLLVANTEYENLSRELDELEEQIERCFASRAKASENIEELREKIHAAELENSSSAANIAVLENDIKHITETVEETASALEQAGKSEADTEKLIDSKLAEADGLAAQAEQVAAQIKAAEEQLLDISRQTDKFGKDINDSNAELNGFYIRKSELNYRRENAKNNIAETEDAVNSLFEEKQTVGSSLEKALSESREIASAMEGLDDDIADHNNKLSGYRLLHQKRSAALEDAQKKFSENELKMSELRQRERILTDLENSMEGFSHSVRTVIKASRQGRLSGVYGSVAQIISVGTEYSLAVETALGAALQNIVVENEETAKRGIGLLKESGAGRATFLPLTSVKGKRLAERSLENEEGFVALACDLVKFDGKFTGIIDQLLGRVAVTENIDLASVIARKYGYRFRIVTLDGQVVNVGGSYTGGSSSRSAGILTRKHEIEELADEIKQLAEVHEELKKKRTVLDQEVQKLTFDMEGEKELINTLSGDKIRFEGEKKRLCELADSYRGRLEEIDKETEELRQRLIQANAEINDSVKELSELENKIAMSEEAIRSSKSLIENAGADREKLSSELSGLRIRETELRKDEQSCRRNVETLKSEIEDSVGSRQELNEKIKSCRQAIADKQKEIAEIRSRIDGSGGVISGYEQQITMQQNEYNMFDAQAAKFRQQQKIKNDEKESVSKDITRYTDRKTVLQGDFDKIIAELWEQYEMSRSDAVGSAEPIEDMNAANKKLNELKGRIRNLGTVNLSAVEEYREVSERYQFMSAQMDDVLRSKSELERMISELTDNMKTIFTDSFAKINENFKKIFSELFGGGKAELSFTDPENVLECGIDIMVAPPGKVIKNLSLLSGGEQAFVAICIYFAILKVHPSPFCLLDEIEAALDDVNVTKYAQYLRNFTGTTQFILITHRRGTMEEADVLYGVTMQEKGVSKLLKMNVGDDLDLDGDQN